ncbi:MAG: DUF1223 domain-containing protein [Limnobacter sp.]|nr:DUF1223 domain-containing protein [Limnobacter sp.]
MVGLFQLSLGSSPAMAQNAQCTFKSPAHRMVVAELYTSEGCSSCPPADRWLSKELKNPLRTQQVLPLSFHVDYWDYIGWKDPYAKPQYTARQYSHKTAGNTKIIYTPQYLFSGKEAREWRDLESFRQLLASKTKEAPPLNIQLSFKAASSHLGSSNLGSSNLGSIGELQLTVQTEWFNKANTAGRVYVAVYEDGLSQKVTAGENRGEALKHDGVVRSLIGPYKVTPNAPVVVLKASLETGWNRSNLGVGVFVENEDGTQVLQALNAPNALKNTSQCI